MTSNYLFKSLTSLEINRRRKRSHGFGFGTYTSVEVRKPNIHSSIPTKQQLNKANKLISTTSSSVAHNEDINHNSQVSHAKASSVSSHNNHHYLKPFLIGSITLAGKHLSMITLTDKDLIIIALSDKDLDIITLADKDLGITIITCLITVFSDQSTQAISHHIEETPICTIQVHNHAFKHFISQSLRVTLRQFTSSCSTHSLFFISTPFNSFRCNKWTI
ncbi:hypothetical protein H5410_041716 [Solanum commersonii]|uniref:Uncharacterized protein n=1 Tax=Solanum commersonii TaxID=4109 RepID=A0A9J5XTW2_SOLCO|nr:hypothetical protein H5410_041716 [Solanum commersonii]